MRVQTSFTTAIALVALVAAAVTFAGESVRNGRGGGDSQGRLYDPKTVETLSGEILSLDRITGPNGRGGIHANLKTDKGETIPVHLGPAWYLDQQTVTLKPSDKVTVRGSRVSMGGKPAIIAAEVIKDGNSILLRDENGVPVWAGTHRPSR